MRRATIGTALAGVLVAASAPVAAEALGLEQVLQRVLDLDASLEVARLNLERARQEFARVESQLGWNLNAQAGVAREFVTVFGSATDRAEVGAGLERRLSSGSSVGLSAGYAYEDAARSFSPLVPNPSQLARLDLNYRLPLARGADNPAYRQGLASAAAGSAAAAADWAASRDAVARVTADLFYAAAFTRARMENAAQAIDRSERLKRFVLGNIRLGIAEDKDRLQAEAQLQARRAEHQALAVLWEGQRTALNRLMERAWDAALVPALHAGERAPLGASGALEAEVAANSPELSRTRAGLAAAEATLARARDASKDQLDLVMSLGNRRFSGDVPGASVAESEAVGGVRLEYRAALDRRGADAELTQAQIERSIALRRIEALQIDLRYRLAGLLAEIDSAATALARFDARRDAERAKLDEAALRYRTGRGDTQQLILFENDLYAAELLAEQQAIELARRHTELALLSGRLWRGVRVPGPEGQGR